MDKKHMISDLQVRFEMVNNRLTALNQEKVLLDVEQCHLAALIELYVKNDYDPIIEERRVTTALLATPAPKNGRQSKYMEDIELIFMDTGGKNIKYKVIYEKLCRLQGFDVSSGAIGAVLTTLERQGKVKKIERGIYKWLK